MESKYEAYCECSAGFGGNKCQFGYLNLNVFIFKKYFRFM